MSIDNLKLEQLSSAHVLANLKFFLPNGEKPKVLMSDDYTQENNRTGKFQDEQVLIRNCRMVETAPRLETEGFELQQHRSNVQDYYDETQITDTHYSEIIHLLKTKTGAANVYVFDHTVRVQDTNKRQVKDTRGPVNILHNDYTEKSGPQRITDLLDSEKAKRVLSGRFALVNVWRSIGPNIQRLPLAVADAKTMSETDFVATDMVYSDRIGEIYQIAWNAQQSWNYFPNMTRDEVLLLKCFDSAHDGRARYTAHGAFEDTSVPFDTAPRESIEIRTVLSFN